MTSLRPLLLSSLLATTLFACGEDDGPQSEPVDTQSAQNMVRENLKAASGGIKTGVQVVDQSKMFERTGFTQRVEYECNDSFSDDGSFLGGECTEVVTKVDMSSEVDNASSEVQKFLDKYIFVPENLESSEPTRLTYLMRGSVFCAEAAEPANCATELDKVQLRLVVTSPSKGDVSISFLVGPDRHNPGSLDLFKDRVGMEADLGGIKRSLSFLSVEFPDAGIHPNDLPKVMAGRLRGEFSWSGTSSAQASFGVVNALRIENDGPQPVKINVAAAPKALSLTMDAVANLMTYQVDWKAIDLDIPIDITRPVQDPIDPFDFSQEERIQADLKFHTDALGALGKWNAASDLIEFALNLGSGPAYAEVNATRVFEAMLNPADGNRLEGTMQYNEAADTLTVMAKNALDATVKMNFAPVADALKDDDMRNAELNETYKVTAEKSTTVEISQGYSKVLAGALSLLTVNSKEDFTAGANQCFAGGEGEGIVALEIVSCQ